MPLLDSIRPICHTESLYHIEWTHYSLGYVPSVNVKDIFTNSKALCLMMINDAVIVKSSALVQVMLCHLIGDKVYFTDAYKRLQWVEWMVSIICIYDDSVQRHRRDTNTSSARIELKNVAKATHKQMRPSDVIWHHRSGLTLAQVMACCLTTPSHYQNRGWILIDEVLWHLPWSIP